MKLKWISPYLIILLLLSCKNEEENLPQVCEENPTAYFNFKKGSYWIYQWYSIDTLQNETIRNTIDTIVNIGDTIINGARYTIQKGTYLSLDRTNFYRDSSGYLVNEKGKIHFSATNFDEVFRVDTLGSLTAPVASVAYEMDSPDATLIRVPAGDFDCLNFIGNYTALIDNLPWEMRRANSYFAKDVGLVKSTTFYSSSTKTLERRLIEYNLN